MGEYPKVKLDYSRDLEIDQNSLELEWLAIAGKIMAYSEAHVQAIFDRDRAKQRRDVAEAELDRQARSEPYPEDLPISEKTKQPTETAILNWVHKQDKYQAAQRERQEAEYVVNLLQAAVFAFQAKKMALENLVRLFGMKYYAEPYEPQGANMGGRSMEAGRQGVNEAMRTRPPVDGNTPKVSVTLGPLQAPQPVPTRDKDGHRYAIGVVRVPFQGTFTAGPWPDLQWALDYVGLPGQGIYRLTKGQPDELIYIWTDGPPSGWVDNKDPEVKTAPCVVNPGPSKLPPRRLPPRR